MPRTPSSITRFALALALTIVCSVPNAQAQGKGGASRLNTALASSSVAATTMAACVADAVAKGISPTIASRLCAIEVSAMLDKRCGDGGDPGGRA